MDMKGMRNKINLIDYQIIALLKERMELKMRLRKSKDAVSEAGEESETLAGVRNCSQDLYDWSLEKASIKVLSRRAGLSRTRR